MKREDLIAAMRAAAAAKPRAVEVQGWGTVFVKALTVEQVDLQQQARDEAEDGKDPLRFARAAARILCDADGVLLFDPDTPEDLALLAAQPWDLMKEVLGTKDQAITDEGKAAAKNG